MLKSLTAFGRRYVSVPSMRMSLSLSVFCDITKVGRKCGRDAWARVDVFAPSISRLASLGLGVIAKSFGREKDGHVQLNVSNAPFGPPQNTSAGYSSQVMGPDSTRWRRPAETSLLDAGEACDER
jgi:hypothetical protein